jgi:type II secretory pathway pseudopilin PulG
MALCIHCGQEVPESAQICPHCGKSLPGAATATPVKRSAMPIVMILFGVGCLGLLVIGGILAAIAIPNFLSARDRAALHQTMASMQTVAAALDSYYRQNGGYPSAGSLAELQAALQPHAASLPREDGWDHEFRYLCWPAAPRGCEHYTLASAGKDGRFEQEDLSAYQGEQTPFGAYERDLVMLDGSFLQYSGSQ